MNRYGWTIGVGVWMMGALVFADAMNHILRAQQTNRIRRYDYATGADSGLQVTKAGVANRRIQISEDQAWMFAGGGQRWDNSVVTRWTRDDDDDFGWVSKFNVFEERNSPGGNSPHNPYLRSPTGMSLDDAGWLWVGDDAGSVTNLPANDHILRLDPTQTLTYDHNGQQDVPGLVIGRTDSASNYTFGAIWSLRLGPDRNADAVRDLYVSDAAANSVFVFDPTATDPDNAYIETLIDANSDPGDSLNDPRGMLIDDQYLYLADTGDDKLRRFDLADGSYVDTIVTDGGATPFNNVFTLQWGPDDTIMANSGNDLLEYTKDGTYVRTISGTGNLAFDVFAIPEPTTLALWLLGLAAVFRGMRTRHSD